MIFLAITSIFAFGLACNYFGWRKGFNEGIEMTKRDYNSKLNDHIEKAMQKEMSLIMEKYDKILKERNNK